MNVLIFSGSDMGHIAPIVGAIYRVGRDGRVVDSGGSSPMQRERQVVDVRRRRRIMNGLATSKREGSIE